MFVSCTEFVLSGRGLCDGPIPRPEESYQLWCVFECDQVKTKTLYTCCEQVGRRGKDYETKRKVVSLSRPTNVKDHHLSAIRDCLLSTLQVLLTRYYSGAQFKEDEMGGSCGTYGREEKCVHGFGGKTSRKETFLKT
jgi:hypothetical protein